MERFFPHTNALLFKMNIRYLAPFALVATCAFAQAQQKLELKPNDHIAIVGGSIADRMQHTGYLETLIQQRFPEKELVFRHLGVAADEVGTWHRSQNFGSREEWFKRTGATVVFAFYGYNESFKGAPGLDGFKGTLQKFVKDTQATGARVVLFSPIAAEKMSDPNFADPKSINENVKLYAAAVEAVAKESGAQFVDLFAPSQAAYQAAAAKGQSLTINGWFLSEAGDKALAPAMFQGLFGESPQTLNEKLRVAVNQKNWEFHQRYRTVDGYNVYGGRSQEKYQPRVRDEKEPSKIINKPGTGPILNYTVMQREMQIRDVMTANREQRVWAIAKGSDLVVKDDNLPEPISAFTNKPGDKPDLSHTYPSGEEVMAKLKLAPNCKINLFADEKQFPELANPLQMQWDTKGRLWVAVWKNYPEREPTSKDGDKILILEDTDGDGKADKCTTFMDNLNAPTGFTLYKDGVAVMQAPDLWYARDTNGDNKADTFERIAMGVDSADSHHSTNAMVREPGGATFFSDGVFHRTQIETTNGPIRHADGCLWRFDFNTGNTELYAAYELVNAHGKVFDRWGNDLVTNATMNETYFAPAISGRLDSGKHPGMQHFWNRPSRPCPGTGMVSSAHFPEDWQGDFLNLNVIGLQAITRVRVTQDGSGLKGMTIENLVSGDPAQTPTFRPICVSNGPDGAIYFCDWSQTIIGHLQHHLRDTNRDHEHGRIYRITYEGRPLSKPAKIDGQPIPALLDLLKSPIDDTRMLAKIELEKHPVKDVIAAAKTWVAGLDKTDKEFEHHLTEALWLHQWQNVVDVDLLKRVLKSPNPQARAAATRVLCYWRNSVPDAIALLKVAAGDEDARVRLQAVRAASFFDGKNVPEAFQITYASLAQRNDYYLDYVYKETMRQLHSLTKENILPSDPRILAAYVSKLSDKDLNGAPDSEPVFIERIERKGTDLGKRMDALTNLAAIRKTDKVTELVTALQHADANGGGAADELAKILATSTAAELGKARAALSTLAGGAQQPGVRRAAVGALVVADGQPDKVWAAAKDDDTRSIVLNSIAGIADPALRAKFQTILTKAIAIPALHAAAMQQLPLTGADFAKHNFATLAAAVREGNDRTVAVRAILQLPRESWDKAVAGPVAESILTWAKTVPAGDRTKQDYIETAQLGGEFAALMAPADAARIRKELRALSVSVYVLHTVHEKMSYDQKTLVVEAGKPFEIVLENADTQSHNLAVVKPGTHEKVGTASSTMTPDKLDKAGRPFIPQSDDILAATKLIEPGQKQTLKVAAIYDEGEFEYVCTVPGHYIIMWGKLIVTKDVDAYLAAPHPAK